VVRQALEAGFIFGLDATASRQHTWDTACKLQADMFREVATAGGLEVQLVYFRGDSQCAASRWTTDAAHLGKVMTGIMPIVVLLEHEDRHAQAPQLAGLGDKLIRALLQLIANVDQRADLQ
jgi:hypothetical protein